VAVALWREIEETVVQTQRRSGWRVTQILAALGIARSTYYQAAGGRRPAAVSRNGPGPYGVLPEERAAIIDYARRHPDLRHRELAWRMVDEDVAYVSPSTVYRLLREADLVHRWERPEPREKRRRVTPTRPDERWQSDICYVRVGRRWYYLITFADECSRYIVHHELVRWMDGHTISLAAQEALDRLPPGATPVIQTDRGSGYVSREFKLVLSERGIGHHRIRPHCPEENGMIERLQRTLVEKVAEYELVDYASARDVVAGIIRWYNEDRLHSAINYLRPIDVYRGEPEKILEQRRRKLADARAQRKEENQRRRQHRLPTNTTPTEENRTLIQQSSCPI
jgi:putative transposase